MEQIVFNLVRNLLIVKNGFKTSGKNVIAKSEKVINLNNEEIEITTKFYNLGGSKILLVTRFSDIQYYISNEERIENKPEKVAKRIYKEMQKYI
ncbi:hypothetical protein [Acinetobacter pittii]|uniref:Uncharacterized protein n=1 Tax=Acinetobacter pittii TaxID=48296 RepID=A0A6H0G064_ACIPI|nr:hypothetical protein [Acinetobacter pittii]QIT20017.1 hypothetical protein G8E09_19600 [Acinetobacter pittii]